jgi:hypothetical protein
LKSSLRNTIKNKPKPSDLIKTKVLIQAKDVKVPLQFPTEAETTKEISNHFDAHNPKLVGVQLKLQGAILLD